MDKYLDMIITDLEHVMQDYKVGIENKFISTASGDSLTNLAVLYGFNRRFYGIKFKLFNIPIKFGIDEPDGLFRKRIIRTIRRDSSRRERICRRFQKLYKPWLKQNVKE